MVKGGKNKKKKNWKLRRQLRRTFGCLFLISAIIVGAIPVQSTQAASSGVTGITWVQASALDAENEVKAGKPVFYTEDGRLQFAYTGSGTSWGATIAGYVEGTLPNGLLTIPDVTDGYVQYGIPAADGSGMLYYLAAADVGGNPLYYKKPAPAPAEVESEIPVIDFEMENGGVVVDSETNEAVTTTETESGQSPEAEPAAQEAQTRAAEVYLPCLFEEKDIWKGLEETNGLYIVDPADPDPAHPTSFILSTRLKDVTVKYISGTNTPIDSNGKSWGTPADAGMGTGVFGGSKAQNIKTVVIGSSMLGIGNYAFAGSSNLNGIKLGNGLNTIGNYAFAECINMVYADLDLGASVQTLGAFAFSGCTELTSFNVPTATRNIGDFCFQNCKKLRTINFLDPNSESDSTALKDIGYKAFLNCESLESLTFPGGYKGTDKDHATGGYFHISTVQGCNSLAFISAKNENFNLTTTTDVDGGYGYEQLRNEMLPEFYLEGRGYSDSLQKVKSAFRKTANDERIAFSYWEFINKGGKFEIVKYASKHTLEDDNSINLIFAVNKSNQLISFEMVRADGAAGVVKPAVIVLPEVIGPYAVAEINEGSFSNNCYVEKIVLPKSLTTINERSFKGNHNLKHIIFNDTTKIVSVGSGAYATQECEYIIQSDGTLKCNKCGELLDKQPYLSFSGKIASDDGKNTEPFKYAMKSTSKVNNGSQVETYITYYSGWPTNLTVMFNKATGMSELIDYPTVQDLKDGFVLSPPAGGTARNITDTGIGLGAGAITISGNIPPTDNSMHKNGYQYPYITLEQSVAAKEAISKYESGTDLTGLQKEIVDSAVLGMVIPTGVNSIRTGLFSGVDSKNEAVVGTTKNSKIKSLTLSSVDTLEPYAFSKLENLETFNMLGGSTIGDYTFNDCNKLLNVEIGPSVMKLGLRPFKSCDILNNVSFPNSASFACNESIIFGKAGDALTSIVECLETRGASSGRTTVGPEELKGIKKIEPEAFMNCDGIGEVDLSQSEIAVIPRWCFADYAVDPDKVSTAGPNGGLGKVVLPSTATSIDPGAFWNSRVYSVVIPSSVTYIEPNAFSYTNNGWDGTTTPTFEDANHRQITFICLDSSPAATYASKYPYINTKETDDLKAKYTVWFFDAVDQTKPTLIEKQQVIHGQDAKLPTPPVHEGYTFTQWYPANAEKAVSRDNIEISAFYTKNGAVTHTVQFLDWDDKTLDTQVVEHGKDAKAPTEPTREGYVFTGWRPGFTNITDNLTVYAQYEKKDTSKFVVSFYNHDGTLIGERQQVEPGKSAIEPAHPTREGYTFTGWQPADTWKNVTKDVDVYAVFEKGTSGGGDNGGGNNGNNGNNGSNGNNGNNNNNNNNNNGSSSGNSVSGNSTKYKVVVNGGSGSGDYTAGTIVNINAYATSDGKVFDKWTSSSFGVGFVNVNAISTTFTMPTNNVEITANFKTQSSVSSNTRNLQRNTATTVDVNKGGISDKDIASANVNGSSDNYIVKITEDAQATEAVIAALEAKYGDLGNIAYLPMDISLYDATGQYKITDLGGVTVDITLPLPDELRQYGGNNMAGSVVNGTLENLNPKFTVIDGVPCVQFTATHFSPYVIYVDKANLTAGAIDATPQTGDPIHPKWFLAIGLACIAVILFCKKDKRAQLKTV